MNTNSRQQPPAWLERLAIVLSVALLCGAGLESRKFRPPPDTRIYLDRVQSVANAFPLDLGDWHGQDVPVEQSAVKLLRPKVILSRRYLNNVAHMAVGFLFVDCSDARDTVGHYPPICYPSQGYSMQATVVRDWALPRMNVRGTEYSFVRNAFDAGGSLVVDDFFVLPGVGISPDRAGVIQAAGDLQRRFYGVAQVQLVFSSEYTAEQRQLAFSDLIGPLENVMQTVLTIRPQSSGENPGPPGSPSVNGDAHG